MEIPFWTPWIDCTIALVFGDGQPEEVLVTPSLIGGGLVAELDGSENVEWLPLEDGWSPSGDSTVCPEENVTNSCACAMESLESLEGYSTATVTNNSI